MYFKVERSESPILRDATRLGSRAVRGNLGRGEVLHFPFFAHNRPARTGAEASLVFRTVSDACDQRIELDTVASQKTEDRLAR